MASCSSNVRILFQHFDPKAANYSWILIQNQIIALHSFPGEDVRCREVETFQGTINIQNYHNYCLLPHPVSLTSGGSDQDGLPCGSSLVLISFVQGIYFLADF